MAPQDTATSNFSSCSNSNIVPTKSALCPAGSIPYTLLLGKRPWALSLLHPTSSTYADSEIFGIIKGQP